MIETLTAKPGGRVWASVYVTTLAAVSAALVMVYGAILGLGERDTEAMESPLILSVARQVDEGPQGLYGPYGGSNPLVLIHAPLYYRAAALLAWPMFRGGLPSVVAARVAGRAISVASLLATLAAAYRLGRLGGLPRRAGWWSAMLVAASPVLAGQPFAVRPDMAGVALQSWGVASVMGSGGSQRRLGWASILFGLACCVKQNLLVGWAISVLVVAWAGVRGRCGPGALAWVVMPGVAVAGSIYGAEWVVTGGRVWEAAFVAASHVGRVHPGSWNNALIVFMGIVNRSAGSAATLASAAFIAAGLRPGFARWIATAAGTLVIGILLTSTTAFLFTNSSYAGAATLPAVCLVAATALPAAAASRRSSAPRTGVEGVLWACLIAELGLVALLARTSSGAWINYGIPAAVFVAALAGRGLSRAIDPAPPAPVLAPALLAGLVILVVSTFGIWESFSTGAVERAKVESLFEHFKRPRSESFFVNRPGLNRMDGRLELVYDDWLYPVFESIGLAEPRPLWLPRKLVTGPCRAIVNGSEGKLIEGTTIEIRRLGFRPEGMLPPFYVWVR